MSNLNSELKELLVSGLKLHDVTAADIGDDTPLFDRGLGLDSLDAVEMVVLVKKKYGVQIKDMNEGQQAFASINAMAQFIRERQGAL